jgi:hypothetical protein
MKTTEVIVNSVTVKMVNGYAECTFQKGFDFLVVSLRVKEALTLQKALGNLLINEFKD